VFIWFVGVDMTVVERKRIEGRFCYKEKKYVYIKHVVPASDKNRRCKGQSGAAVEYSLSFEDDVYREKRSIEERKNKVKHEMNYKRMWAANPVGQ
jgi:hypothetical protein